QSSLHRLGGAKVTLSAVVGETELTGAELAAVEEGDVVVVENFMLAPDLRTGKAVVTAGRGRNARVHAAVVDAGGRYGLSIERFERVKEPDMAGKKSEEPELNTNPGEEGANLRETAGLLGDVPLVVKVELGRV